jgi:hypothetical protein
VAQGEEVMVADRYFEREELARLFLIIILLKDIKAHFI